MEQYIQILNFAIPGFLVLIAIEFFTSKLLKKEVYRGYDTVTSLSSGLTNILKDVLGLTIVIFSYDFMVKHFAQFEIQSVLWLVIICFIFKDFVGYWTHRFEHVINIFWNRHIIHHSSEEFNLACALRQPISNIIAIFGFFFLPLAIIGVPTEIIAIVSPLHLFAQFWYHTRLIRRLGFLEYILVTPSHHRVHHAINDEYLDKNFSQVFIIWDRLFGTFQEEQKDIPAVYGVKRPSNTWNPILINFKHLWLLIKDAWRADNWLDKLRIWFMPTGWRPVELIERFPEYAVTDVYNMEKYQSPNSRSLLLWTWAQLLLHLFLMLVLFNNIGDLSGAELIGYTIFMFTSLFAFTSLMDRSILALISEVFKCTLGLSLILTSGDWMNLNHVYTNAYFLVIIYLIISLLTTLYFLYFEKTNQPTILVPNTNF